MPISNNGPHLNLVLSCFGLSAASLLLFVASSMTIAQEVVIDVPREPIDFARQVRPILAKHCFRCHGPTTQESSLQLHEFELATSVADSGEPAILPGDSENSPLTWRISSREEAEQMPPAGNKRLSDSEVETIELWIEQGAKYSLHWAFQALSRPPIPAVTNSNWTRNAIDRFLLKRLESKRLHPSDPASPRHLIRRAYMNAIGLPPTPEEVEAFAADSSDSAYTAMVDRLLADPRFGERWGRHWLDVVRYAETNSFERDGLKPNAWKYRDYVIGAFNADKPYDRFIHEQLAGDELDAVTHETLSATGYYRLGIWDDEPADPLQARFDEYDDIVTTTSQAFMAMTINCARCHDHKIDPIPQRDYYQLVAFFRDVTSYGSRGDERTNNQIEASPAELTAQYKAFQAELQTLRKQMEAIEKLGIEKMPAEDQRATEGNDRKRILRQKLQQYLSQEQWSNYTRFQEHEKNTDQRLKALPPQEAILGLAQCEVSPPKTFILQRGSPQAEGAEVQPAFPNLFGSPAPKLPDVSPNGKSAGRRRVLAEWMTSDENWLTARTIVNRIWQHHFGRGLVRSPNNFGLLGEQPTHPQLLDWLATELIRNDWQMKSIHRQIMLSTAYRMSSQADPKSLAIDPSNDSFWRFNMRRLSAEEVRDSVLATTGTLNLQKRGPSIYPDVADEVKAGQSVPGKGWEKSSASDKARRSAYIHIKRSLIPPELANFDFPETDSSCEARFLTTQPAQALGMLNGQFLQDQSRELAARVRRECGPDIDRQLGRAIELALCRPATPADIELGHELLAKLASKYNLLESECMRYYCLVVLNMNEFMYLD